MYNMERGVTEMTIYRIYNPAPGMGHFVRFETTDITKAVMELAAASMMSTNNFEPRFSSEGVQIFLDGEPIILRGGAEWKTAETDPEKAMIAIHQMIVDAGGFDGRGWAIEAV